MSHPKWTHRVRAYLPPIALACVATSQLVRVDGEALTRWKGGGFGMYSDFHVKHREVWVETNPDEATAVPRVPRSLQVAADDCARFANIGCLRELEAAVRRDFPQARGLQIMTYDVRPEDSTFARRSVAAWTFTRR